MAAAQILSLTRAVDSKVTGVGNKLNDVDDKMDIVMSGWPGLFASHEPNTDCVCVLARWKGRKVGTSADF